MAALWSGFLAYPVSAASKLLRAPAEQMSKFTMKKGAAFVAYVDQVDGNEAGFLSLVPLRKPEMARA